MGAAETVVRLGELVRPVSLAADRVVAMPEPWGLMLPGGGLRRGSVMSIEGARGAGVTSVALRLAAAVTGIGEWAAFCTDDLLAAPAVHEAEVAPSRLVVVRAVPSRRRAEVLAALVEGVSLAVVGPAHRPGAAEARKLAARARERGTILVSQGPWPARADLRLRVEGSAWRCSSGRLEERELALEVEHRGRSVHRSLVA